MGNALCPDLVWMRGCSIPILAVFQVGRIQFFSGGGEVGMLRPLGSSIGFNQPVEGKMRMSFGYACKPLASSKAHELRQSGGAALHE